MKKFILSCLLPVILVAFPSYSLENKAETSSKENNTAIIKNMLTLQTLIETHGFDWKGLYPDSLEALKKEASIKETFYWKPLSNPITGKTDIGESLIDFATYERLKTNPESVHSLKGLAVYQPLECKENKDKKRNLCNTYKIYGLDETGNILKKKGETFYLTNG